jgi:aryl-alcohol dehydrogenase-like predicted oxidoreductase
MPQLPGTDLTVSPLCLGGNVFGWTADEPASFAMLDRYDDATPSTQAPFVDTAESYGAGASERILGAWMADRGTRDRVVVATKASPMEKDHPLSRGEILAAADRSLENLRTDRIDLYYAHYDDETTPLEETLRAFDELVRRGRCATSGRRTTRRRGCARPGRSPTGSGSPGTWPSSRTTT